MIQKSTVTRETWQITFFIIKRRWTEFKEVRCVFFKSWRSPWSAPKTESNELDAHRIRSPIARWILDRPTWGVSRSSIGILVKLIRSRTVARWKCTRGKEGFERETRAVRWRTSHQRMHRESSRGINRFLHSVQQRATAPPPVSFNEETSRRAGRSDYSANCER